MTDALSQKKALRKSISARLKALSLSEIEEQSRCITAHALSLPAFQSAKSVSCYLNMPHGEVNTTGITSAILAHGKHLFVPKILPSTGRDSEMVLFKVDDPSDLDSLLPSGAYGIREPELTSSSGIERINVMDLPESEGLDIIFVPGVAFDRSRNRLGHGKGYYDRFLSAYAASSSSRSRTMPLLVALSLTEQLVGSVPTTEHDWKMDVVVTPEGVV